MKLHFLQHVPFEGLGSIKSWAMERDLSISCTQLYNDEPFPEPSEIDFLVVMGGPMGVYEVDAYPWLSRELDYLKQVCSERTKILGVCLGAQLLASALGAGVYPGQEKEIGWYPIFAAPDINSTVLQNTLPERISVFHWHGDTFDLPADAIRLAYSEGCENQGFIVDERILGFQFHLETTKDSATELIENCREELVSGRFIQAETEILSNSARFVEINRLMNNVLDNFVLGTGR